MDGLKKVKGKIKHVIRNIRRRLLPRTLFGRSLLIILIPLLLLQMIVAFIFFDRHWDSMTGKLVDALTAEVGVIVDILQNKQDLTSQANIIHFAQSLGLEVSIEKERSGHSLMRPTEELTLFGIDRRLANALKRRLKVPFLISGHQDVQQDRAFEISVELDQHRLVRIICSARRLSSATTHIFILWLMSSAMVLFGVALLFMRNQIRPIRRLAIAAEKFGKGQDVAHFRLEGAIEVRQAAQAFLEMKDRLKRQMEQRTTMLAGVSHDLRTPLTRMKLELAFFPSTSETEQLREDIEEMEKMIAAYLAFAKDDGDESVEFVDVRAVIERLVSNFKRQGGEVDAVYNLPVGFILKVRPVAFERAVGNVLSNGCKYSHKVWISASLNENKFCEILIDDNGPGIPISQREDVFRPFYRLEKSRNKKTGGIGLGLSITRDVVHSHGGDILLSDSPRGGLRVILRLPT